MPAHAAAVTLDPSRKGNDMFGRNGVPRERIDVLRQVPLFEGLSNKVLSRIDKHLDEVDVPAGEVLTSKGTRSYEVFVIADGVAEVRVDDEVTRETEVGELIGEIGVLQRSLRTATVVA